MQEVTRHGVERAERLVHEQHVGVLRQRPRERDALAHSAGELVRSLLPELREVDEVEQLVDTRSPRSAFGTLRSLSARSMLPRAVSHGNSADSWNISVVRPFDVPWSPYVARVEAGEDVEQRALAAPGRAEQAHELALRDVERDASSACTALPAWP